MRNTEMLNIITEIATQISIAWDVWQQLHNIF